jgi:hypothetical protein
MQGPGGQVAAGVRLPLGAVGAADRLVGGTADAEFHGRSWRSLHKLTACSCLVVLRHPPIRKPLFEALWKDSSGTLPRCGPVLAFRHEHRTEGSDGGAQTL